MSDDEKVVNLDDFVRNSQTHSESTCNDLSRVVFCYFKAWEKATAKRSRKPALCNKAHEIWKNWERIKTVENQIYEIRRDRPNHENSSNSGISKNIDDLNDPAVSASLSQQEKVVVRKLLAKASRARRILDLLYDEFMSLIQKSFDDGEFPPELVNDDGSVDISSDLKFFPVKPNEPLIPTSVIMRKKRVVRATKKTKNQPAEVAQSHLTSGNAEKPLTDVQVENEATLLEKTPSSVMAHGSSSIELLEKPIGDELAPSTPHLLNNKVISLDDVVVANARCPADETLFKKGRKKAPKSSKKKTTKKQVAPPLATADDNPPTSSERAKTFFIGANAPSIAKLMREGSDDDCSSISTSTRRKRGHQEVSIVTDEPTRKRARLGSKFLASLSQQNSPTISTSTQIISPDENPTSINSQPSLPPLGPIRTSDVPELASTGVVVDFIKEQTNKIPTFLDQGLLDASASKSNENSFNFEVEENQDLNFSTHEDNPSSNCPPLSSSILQPAEDNLTVNADADSSILLVSQQPSTPTTQPSLSTPRRQKSAPKKKTPAKKKMPSKSPSPIREPVTTQEVVDFLREYNGQRPPVDELEDQNPFNLPHQDPAPSSAAADVVDPAEQQQQHPEQRPLSKYEERKIKEDNMLKAAANMLKLVVNHNTANMACEELYERFLSTATEHAKLLKMHYCPLPKSTVQEVSEVDEANPPQNQEDSPPPRPPRQFPLTRRAHVKRLRGLYRTNMKKCFNEVVQDPPKWCTATPAQIAEAFSIPPPTNTPAATPAQVSTGSPPPVEQNLHPAGYDEEDPYNFMRNYSDLYISPEDVLVALARAKKDTACGTDGLQMILWKKIPQLEFILAPLFNLMIHQGTVPSSWMESRLILLPKKEDPTTDDPLQYRPISITQTLYRVFMSCLNRKLKPLIELSPSQKGFRECDGCVEHAFTLQEVLDDSRRGRSKLNVVWIDIQKAFDSVPHNLIIEHLQKAKIPANVVTLIRNLYSGSYNLIQDRSGNSANLCLNGRGVRQGCPLSPLLFNIVINPLLERISESGIGYPLFEQRIGAQCFADDLVLLSNNVDDMDKLLKMTEEFLTASQLRVNHSKCASLKVSYKSARRVINELYADSPKLFGQPIPPINDFYKYLGTHANLQSFKDLPPCFEKFAKNLEKLSDSPLLHFQKINLLKIYLLPTLDFVMKNHILRIDDLSKFDALIARNLRKWLGLPNSSTTHLFYVPNCAGGLGIRQLTKDYAGLRLASGLNVLNSSDEAIQKIARTSLKNIVDQRSNFQMSPLTYLHEDKEPTFTRDIRSLLSSLRLNRKSVNVDLYQPADDSCQLDIDSEALMPPINPPKNPTVIPSRVKQIRWHLQSTHLQKWIDQPDQGRSVLCFGRTKEANSWTRTGNIKISSFRFGLMGRINVLPTKTVLFRAHSTLDTQCRRCSCQIETLGHILNGCHRGKELIIKRHDRVLELVTTSKKKYGKNYELSVNKRFPEISSNRRPDFQLLHRRSKTLIVGDVSVCYESSLSRLDQVREHKIQKYEPEFQMLRNLGYTILPTALIFGSLGSHHSRNDEAYTLLQLSSERKRRTLLKTVTASLIEDSHKIWNNHVRTSN